ncbi:MAG: hypothetical protein NC434_08230 [Ruminococcus sp.]|nr:hypothetical protein [Ruminococcus sp.]
MEKRKYKRIKYADRQQIEAMYNSGAREKAIFNFFAGDTRFSQFLLIFTIDSVTTFEVFQIFYFYSRRNRKGHKGA